MYECEEMWGKQDIVEGDLVTMAKAIVTKYGKLA
jgi:hypothetical protein